MDPENVHELVVEVKEKLEKEHSDLPVGKNGRDDEEMILWFLKDQQFNVENTVTKLSKAILVIEVKEKLEKEHSDLPVGKNGRDDEEMILWFLKDQQFNVENTVLKLAKAISWREDFRVSELTEESVKLVAESGKGYLPDHLDINDRPVLIVEACKHFPGAFEFHEDEKLFIYLVEKTISKLPEGKHEILVIIDLRGFWMRNADLRFLAFFFDAFYNYYPSRLGQILFVDAPFVFKPFWQLVKPLLRSYGNLVRFCSTKEVREEYFTKDTVPAKFEG